MLARFVRHFSKQLTPVSNASIVPASNTSIAPTSSILPVSVSEFTDSSQQTSTDRTSTGRAWKAIELRLKSDDDLNKLWYVVLKEETTLLGDLYLKKQKLRIPGLKPRIDNIKQTKARILTVLREREITRENYWKTLEDEYIKNAEIELKEQALASSPEVPVKEKRVKTEEEILKIEKRNEAKKQIPNWRRMENKERRSAIAKVYGKMAAEYKVKFIKELRYIGHKLKLKNETEAPPKSS